MLQIKLLDGGTMPSWGNGEPATAVSYEDAGLDLYARQGTIVDSGETIQVPLGIKTAFDACFVAVLKDRGSLGAKSLTLMAGVVDSGYRGEWVAIMINLSHERITIKRGDKICQVLFLAVAHPMIVIQPPGKELPRSMRNAGRLGSTGR